MATVNFNESMVSVTGNDTALTLELRDRLTEATIKCTERCLYQSAKWTAELLDALPEVDENDAHMLGADAPTSSYRVLTTSYDDPQEAALEAKEVGKYLLAKSYFDTKEFDRCAAVFLPPVVPAGGLAIFEKSHSRTPLSTPRKTRTKQPEILLPRLSQKSLFLAIYARYLAGEKRKEEESEMVLGPADGGMSSNRELPALTRMLDEYFKSKHVTDPDMKQAQGWLEYLYGVILARSKQEELAQEWLLRAVRLNPYNWGAWEELSGLLSSVDDLNSQLNASILPQNVMTLMYQIHASIHLLSTTDSTATLSSLDSLLGIFPTSTFLLTQQALFYYHSKDYETSASIFQDLLVNDPYRLDGLNTYSNILYVMTDRPKLALLAHLATSVDKFRAETCCVVGNYYSLCSHHEKAVMYFRRALVLDRSFLDAWTLMGHEYIELKNMHAAIESYRRGVDANRKDYRAWYGLGQAYEMLDMRFYALFYYQRAAGLRPYDAKMWQAIGTCYAKMDRIEQAIKALKRALVAGTYYETDSKEPSFSASMSSMKGKASRANTRRKLLDPDTLFNIAELYERMPDEAEASKYMELCLAQETGQNSSPKSVPKSQQKGKNKTSATLNFGQSANVDDEDGEAASPPDSPSSNATQPLSPPLYTDLQDEEDGSRAGFGTGTTATTSGARLWLARYACKNDDLERAERLAEELCMDGFEVEEAKNIIREVQSKRESRPVHTSPLREAS